MTYKPKTTIRGPWPLADELTAPLAVCKDSNGVKQVKRIDLRGQPVKAKVIEYLRRYPVQTVKQISTTLAINKSAVKSAIESLVRLKIIEWHIKISADFRRARHYKVST